MKIIARNIILLSLLVLSANLALADHPSQGYWPQSLAELQPHDLARVEASLPQAFPALGEFRYITAEENPNGSSYLFYSVEKESLQENCDQPDTYWVQLFVLQTRLLIVTPVYFPGCPATADLNQMK